MSPRADSRELMSSSSPSERGPARLRMVFGYAAILWVCLCTAGMARAQDASPDVAEAARQARARKVARAAEASQVSSHVYTNDDLQRARILLETGNAATPSSVAARKEDIPPTISKPPATALPAAAEVQDASATESLGEVARRYRREKAAREALRASTIPEVSPFHLDVARPELAEMLPRPAVLKPAAGLAEKSPMAAVKTVAGIGAVKRDPFARPAMAAVPQRTALPAAVIAKRTPSEDGGRKSPINEFVESRSATVVVVASENAKRAREAVAQPLTMNGAAIAPTPRRGSETVGTGIAQPQPLRPSASVALVGRVGEASGISGGTVAIRAGDSLWKLARRYMSSGTRWREWLGSNPEISDPRRLRPGLRLVVPGELDARTRGGPGGTVTGGAQSVTVRTGDSLWMIAAAHYGHGADWPCVAQANVLLHGNEVIHPGQVLLLPAHCPRALSSQLSRQVSPTP